MYAEEFDSIMNTVLIKEKSIRSGMAITLK